MAIVVTWYDKPDFVEKSTCKVRRHVSRAFFETTQCRQAGDEYQESDQEGEDNSEEQLHD